MDDDEISLSSTVGETHDSDEEWVAEGIIAEGFMDDQTKYLVEWTGFPLHEATWEPVSHLNETLLREWEEKKAKVKRGEEPKFRIKRWRDAAANHLRARHLRHERRNARRAKEGLETEDWEPSLKERIEVLDETTPKDSDNDDSDEESVDFDRLDHPPPAPASQPAKTRPSPTRREPPPPVTHEQTRRIVTIRVPGKPPPRSSAASASATNTNADTTTTTTNKAGASTNNTITHGASTNNRTTTTTNTPPVAASGATKIHNVIPPASAPQPRQGAPAFKSSTDDMSRPGASTPTGGRSSTVVPRKAPTVKSAIKSSNKTAKAATSNVFVSRKQRKPSTHTPNPHNLFFGK